MVEQYQSFEDVKGASDTLGKLRKLGLPPLKGKTFLDIGCNEGFFCEFARRAGAAQVVGIEANATFVERARGRYPCVEFRCQSWDEPIQGHFDVILFASALHYAEDQISLLQRLLQLLTPTGVLVLEVGLTEAQEFTLVRRAAGDFRYFPSVTLLERKLPDYVIRVIGDSVLQSGDPIVRKVLHIVRRRPILLALDGPSYSGKSALCAALVGTENTSLTLVNVDELLLKIEGGTQPIFDSQLEESVRSFCKTRSRFANDLMKFICDAGLLARFIRTAFAVYGAGNIPVIWDGYIPEEHQKEFYDEFESQGYVVWNARPSRLRSFNAVAVDEVIVADPVFRGFRSLQHISLHLDMVITQGDRLVLRGWSLDHERMLPLSQFRVYLGDVSLDLKEIGVTNRLDANQLHNIPPDRLLGFTLTIPAKILNEAMPGWEKSERRPLRLFGYDSEGGIAEAQYQ